MPSTPPQNANGVQGQENPIHRIYCINTTVRRGSSRTADGTPTLEHYGIRASHRMGGTRWRQSCHTAQKQYDLSDLKPERNICEKPKNKKDLRGGEAYELSFRRPSDQFISPF